MHVALVHGYFLHDSGSGVYVRELARALVRLGHDVTLVCQDREPERCDFIDTAYALDKDNTALLPFHTTPRLYEGTCRLVRPDLGGRLLVYVAGRFPGFAREDVSAFQDAPADARDRYIEANVRALRTTFDAWRPDVVLAQHLIMQPYIVRGALGGTVPYVVTEHGSALNYSVRRSEELVPFAVEGLRDAAAVVTVSEAACSDLVAAASGWGLDISDKTAALPPGIDADLFTPAASRSAAISAMRASVELPCGFEVLPDDDVLVYAGSLRCTKGVQYAIAALPLIAQARGKRQRLLIAGDGPGRERLEEFSDLITSGDVVGARRMVAHEELLRSPAELGDVVVDAPPLPDRPSVAFLGHLDHANLAPVFAAADVAVVPSVFPEAAALVNVEAMSAGALPLSAYHSGLAPLDDYLADTFDDQAFRSLTLAQALTARLAGLVVHALDSYPTRDPAFRMRVHEIALRRYPTWEGTARSYLGLAERGLPQRS